MKREIVNTECLVVGGGIVGLATAFNISQTQKCIVIEKDKFLISQTSSRNSGVIHSGIYYPVNSKKNYFCIKGKKILYETCKKNNIEHRMTGKFIISQSNELEKLESLLKLAELKGITVKEVSSSTISNLYPSIKCKHAIYIEDSGIIDVHSLSDYLENQIILNHGLISKQTMLKDLIEKDGYFFSTVEQNNEEYIIKSKSLVLASGLSTNSLLSSSSDSRINKLASKDLFYIGHYYKTKNFDDFRHLIYPIPDKHSLGVHITFGMDNSIITFGPDAKKIDAAEYSNNYFSSELKEDFYSSISTYIPKIRSLNLLEDYVGIRPKTENNDDFEILDFQTHNIKNLIILRSIESPGLTSSLALGKEIAKIIN